MHKVTITKVMGTKANNLVKDFNETSVQIVEGSIPLAPPHELHYPLMCKQILEPRNKFGITFDVVEPGQQLRWRFKTQGGGSLVFAIYRKKMLENTVVPVIEEQKIDLNHKSP